MTGNKVVAGTTADRSRPHYVYRAFDAEDVLLYVGCTQDVTVRLEQHISRRRWNWYLRCVRVDVSSFPNFAEAAEAEAEAIFTEAPVWNVKGRNVNGFICWQQLEVYRSATPARAA